MLSIVRTGLNFGTLHGFSVFLTHVRCCWFMNCTNDALYRHVFLNLGKVIPLSLQKWLPFHHVFSFSFKIFCSSSTFLKEPWNLFFFVINVHTILHLCKHCHKKLIYRSKNCVLLFPVSRICISAAYISWFRITCHFLKMMYSKFYVNCPWDYVFIPSKIVKWNKLVNEVQKSFNSLRWTRLRLCQTVEELITPLPPPSKRQFAIYMSLLIVVCMWYVFMYIVTNSKGFMVI
jgi:hypothetical protein